MVFEQIAFGSRVQRPQDVAFIGVHAEDDNANALILPDDLRGCVQAVEQGHPDVHDDDVGMNIASQPYGFAALGGFAHHFHVRHAIKQKLQPRPDDPVVVRDQNP